MFFLLSDADRLIPPMSRFFGGSRIPLDDFHSADWISAGLMTPEFRDFFREFPNGETGIYYWESIKCDDIFNLRLYEKRGKK